MNGFDESFEGWGLEDSELAVRLLNTGIRRKNIKFKAIAYHLFHKEAKTQPSLHNLNQLENAKQQLLTVCIKGLNTITHE